MVRFLFPFSFAPPEMSQRAILLGSILGGLAFIGFFILLYWCYRKYRKTKIRDSVDNTPGKWFHLSMKNKTNISLDTVSFTLPPIRPLSPIYLESTGRPVASRFTEHFDIV